MSDFPYKIFDSLQDGVLVIDAQFGVHYANAAASLFFDISAKRFKGGKPLEQFVQFTSPLLAEGETLPTQEPSPYKELEFTSTSQKSGSLQITIQPQPLATPSEEPRWILYLRDVSLEKVLADKYRAELDKREAVIEDLRIARAQLEDYSKNLEKKVAERTAELSEANRLMTAILNSLGQGILVFDKDGKCLPFRSKVCADLLESQPEISNITEILKKSENDKASFNQWLEALFSEMIPFEDLCGLGPSEYAHSAGRFVALNFNPMRDDSGNLRGVVMVATDKTAEVEAKKEAERERSFARMVLQTVKYRSQFKSFLSDARSLVAQLKLTFVDQTKNSIKTDEFNEISRHLHTVKGGAATFCMTEVADLAHHAETCLGEFHQAPAKSASFSNCIEELHKGLERFVVQNSDLIGNSERGRTAEVLVEQLKAWAEKTSKLRPELGAEIYNFGVCIPIAESLAHYSSVVAETASQLGKKVHPLKIYDHGVRIDQEKYKELIPTLVHAFRNAVDHAIESPEVRLEKGKSPEGLIEVHCERSVSGLRVEIRDDGQGIDPAKIRARLQSFGWTSIPSVDSELIQVIFEPSFTSRSEVTELSGRGVGLAAVKEAVVNLNGRIWVETQLGLGSKIVFEIPEQDLKFKLAA